MIINSKKMDLLKHVGDISQIAGVRDSIIQGGKAGGVRAFNVRNGSGLEFTVLPDRCMDIYELSFKGINLSYISKTGVVAPQYYQENADFRRNFQAGLLTTCGLSNVGSACVDDGGSLGTHGRISNTPAEEVYALTEWEDDGLILRMGGKVRESKLFGEFLVLEREIITKYKENKIIINDKVANYGFKEEPLMILYHCNLGYPLLSEKSYFVAPSISVIPKNSDAAAGIADYNIFQEPTHGYKEQVFYHELKSDEHGRTFAALVNPELELGAVIRFNTNQLKRMTQWKQMGEGEYVLGIEPCNCHVEGRVNEKQRGTLEHISGGQIRDFTVEIEIIEGNGGIKQLEQSAITYHKCLSEQDHGNLNA